MARAKGSAELDLSSFPPGTYKRHKRYVCLACIFQIFTKQMKMAPRAAYIAIRGHSPGVDELAGRSVARPYFDSEDRFPKCPYCKSTKGKLARFELIQLVASRATTAARKALLDSLPMSEGKFEVFETTASRRDLLFQWLDDLGRRLDFDGDGWLFEVARSFLEKRAPKTDWALVFEGLAAVRRSRKLEEGWEREGARLYLAPALFDELLLLQYLVSRSHKAGGRTFEGRLTLPEMLRRLRSSGYFRDHQIGGEDLYEVLDKLVDSLDEGSASAKVYHVLDRRDFLDKVRSVYAKYA